ncbi:hypothetical protein [Vibrio parahaemolyticus]|uniref:hypothetical protein n=1 Tax=Vibrio parahaemolyticus TaxID=670 RepID=UPI0004728A42|nr:hypothetical protein [Vibrio parahaemolyticus]MBY4653617.1 hypothetical protein [Vibrio parahaemolyticus]
MKSVYLYSANADLYTKVKAGFLLQNSSLNQWCIENGVTRQMAAQVLKGGWSGPKNTKLREQLVQASGLVE